jgi:hypothetical protein
MDNNILNESDFITDDSYITEGAYKDINITNYAIEKLNDAMPGHPADAAEAGMLVGAAVNTYAELRKVSWESGLKSIMGVRA